MKASTLEGSGGTVTQLERVSGSHRRQASLGNVSKVQDFQFAAGWGVRSHPNIDGAGIIASSYAWQFKHSPRWLHYPSPTLHRVKAFEASASL